ncbi:hypothetical protein UPYG_G00181120 [Umbra pygmaea]|uniref:FA complementation group C n=1 Tax=Umbra pygmaea TaxID=75934 RepID=A0ABD0WQL4_UMBPY
MNATYRHCCATGHSASTMSQVLTHTGPTTGLKPQEAAFWLGKAVEWGQAESPDLQRDTCIHLGRLRAFLHLLLTQMQKQSSTTETMRTLPFVGQFLGRLSWNPCVTADAESRSLLFQCLWSLYSEEPQNAVEKKANQWIRNVFCQLATEEDSATHLLAKHVGLPPKEYHRKVLRKMLCLLMEEVGQSCSSLSGHEHRCSCDSVFAASLACISLLTRPETAPLIGALLQRPVTCNRAALSQDFLDAVSSAYSRKHVTLEAQSVVCLWCHSLTSLEGAVMSLLDSVLSSPASTPLSLEDTVTHSLLPKACSQHISIFLVVNDIFRFMLGQVEGNQTLLSLIHTFTLCFLRELTALQTQECVSLKAFFPRTPQSLLVPLLTHSSEMDHEAWHVHLVRVTTVLRRLIEDDEEEGSRGQCNVFETWFLLVQCADWVEVASQLLVSATPHDCGPLLWLLTFYHHPTNRGHHRTQQLMAARETWDHLLSIFLVSAPPPPTHRLQLLAKLILSRIQQASLSSLLFVSLLVNFAVFSQVTVVDATEIVGKVAQQTGLVREAVWSVNMVGFRLNRDRPPSGLSDRVQLRTRALLDILSQGAT